MLEGVLFGAIAFGLLHGINPSHGWTLAILYSLKTRKPMLSGIQSSSILAGGHLLSAIVLVVGYVIATTFVKIPHFYFQYGAAVALGILAYIFWKEKEDDFTETQHGHLHDNTQLLEHEHWHKEGYHSSTGKKTGFDIMKLFVCNFGVCNFVNLSVLFSTEGVVSN